jgi:hypothetical protein
MKQTQAKIAADEPVALFRSCLFRGGWDAVEIGFPTEALITLGKERG